MEGFTNPAPQVMLAMMAKTEKAPRLVGAHADKAIMDAAAALMIESGTREIDVLKLAERAHVTRPTIYARYGRGQKLSVGAVIYLRILTHFLNAARASIEGAMAGVDQKMHSAPTAGDELAAILRGTLTAFKNNKVYGRVVLQELNIRNQEENDLIRPIFDKVDEIIKNAQDERHLSKVLDGWKIRQVLFVLMRGLLRTLYLDQYNTDDKLIEKSLITEKEIEIEILKVLSSYSEERSKSRERVADTIKLLDQKDGKLSPTKSTK